MSKMYNYLADTGSHTFLEKVTKRYHPHFPIHFTTENSPLHSVHTPVKNHATHLPSRHLAETHKAVNGAAAVAARCRGIS